MPIQWAPANINRTRGKKICTLNRSKAVLGVYFGIQTKTNQGNTRNILCAVKGKKPTCEKSGDISRWLRFKSNTDLRSLDHVH